jgi:type VI secretion system protein ImpL
VIIGPPGAGKTTALLNSGLHFPLAEQSLKGVGGTRNLDFWFADEAVLVDTAGRYTTQDADLRVDSAGWASFLKLLKKHRPLQPVNGVIVAIGVDELIRSDCAAIDAHARAVRRRLVELRKTLEAAVPVYVMLTKADLLAGFSEYFDDLDVEGRRAVLGSTMEFGRGKADAGTLARAFDEMAQAVTDRQAKRLFDEPDAMRRGMILGFPAQLQSLRSRAMRFLEGAFAAGDEPAGVLRGFYLTSGIQEGTPLDRILSGMADVYDQPVKAGHGTSGRAYFLNRLLTEVLFTEAGLVTMDTKARNRQRAQLTAALGGIAALALLTLVLWGVSFTRNRAFQSELLARTNAVAADIRSAQLDLVQYRETDPDLRAVLPILNELRTLPRGYADRREGGPPLMMRFGLFQRGLSRQAEETYRDGLRRILLPRVMVRMEQFLAANQDKPMALYEPLKAYLLLGQQHKMEPKAVQSWVAGDWAGAVLPGADADIERRQLGQHLAAMLEDENLAASWPARKPPLDGDVISRARGAMGTLSLADRAYAVMKQNAMSAGPDWQVGRVLTQGDAIAFADPDKVRSTRVPYFFTREGFEKVYTVGLATVQRNVERDLWVFGQDAQSAGLQEEMSNVRPGVAGAYATDYIAAWENVIAAMQPPDYFSDRAAFGAMTKSPSPLKKVLLELRKNTSFEGGVGAVVNRAIQNRINRSSGSQYIREAGAGATGLDAGAEIANHFAAVHDYVGTGKDPAPIDEFVADLKQAGQALTAAASMGASAGFESNQAQAATANAALQGAAAGAPPQLQDFMSKAVGGGTAAQTSAASGAVTQAYAEAILPACREVAQEHYPFFGAAKDDAMPVDMLRVFGMNGTIDSFVQQRLLPMMDRSGPVWRWRSEDPVGSTLDPSSPEQFAKAKDIRDLLTGSLPIRISLVQKGSGVGTVEIGSGGTNYSFDKTGGDPRPLIWSMSGGLPEAAVRLHAVAGGDGGEAPVLREYSGEGPWALFRLFDQGRKQNAGPTTIRVTFGDGRESATFAVELPTENNPFSRGGMWSFRCPVVL